MSIPPAVAEEQSEALADDDASRDVSRQVGEPLATLHAITPPPLGPRDRAEFADLGHPEPALACTEVPSAHPLVDDGRLTVLVAGGRGRRWSGA
ncbi:hypothetical protein IOD16_06255 [Saccharothrix sp. 6-C]|uniref:hypothetical protein n=1 Tax=Saccharothrix sp. 6-C TaxID=2781735 RepID=UPI00191777DD|nr:hypothetical protein [Saccharothrix sp. 6-C]QQQ78077.1 hypothetical protein IOD16_06255 [Saccharothrix sp. 6-C]